MGTDGWTDGGNNSKILGKKNNLHRYHQWPISIINIYHHLDLIWKWWMKNWYYSVAIHEIGEILAPYFVWYKNTSFSLMQPRNYPLPSPYGGTLGFWNTFSNFFVSLGQDLLSMKYYYYHPSRWRWAKHFWVSLYGRSSSIWASISQHQR